MARQAREKRTREGAGERRTTNSSAVDALAGLGVTAPARAPDAG